MEHLDVAFTSVTDFSFPGPFIKRFIEENPQLKIAHSPELDKVVREGYHFYNETTTVNQKEPSMCNQETPIMSEEQIYQTNLKVEMAICNLLDESEKMVVLAKSLVEKNLIKGDDFDVLDEKFTEVKNKLHHRKPEEKTEMQDLQFNLGLLKEATEFSLKLSFHLLTTMEKS